MLCSQQRKLCGAVTISTLIAVTVAQALFLGVLQGLTEMLPVSSSGHLVLAEQILRVQLDPRAMLGFNVALHAGTLLALLLCYARTWGRLIASPFRGDRGGVRLLALLAAATVPAAFAGFFLEDRVAESGTVTVVALSFVATGLILLASEQCRVRRNMPQIGFARAILLGCAQAAALLPGLSRSGTTIGVGRFLGLSRKEAVDFSFLMAVPVIAGAGALTAFHVASGAVRFPFPGVVGAGFLSSLIVSTLTILFLRRFVLTRSLAWFALYLFPVAGILLAIG